MFPVHQRTHDNDASRIRPSSPFAAAAQFGNPIQIVTPLIHDATRIIDRFIHLPGTAVIIQLLSSEQCGPAGIHQIVHHHGGNERNLPWLAFEVVRYLLSINAGSCPLRTHISTPAAHYPSPISLRLTRRILKGIGVSDNAFSNKL